MQIIFSITINFYKFFIIILIYFTTFVINNKIF